MAEENVNQRGDPMASCMEMMKGMEVGSGPAGMCPMAAMFKGVLEKNAVSRAALRPRSRASGWGRVDSI